MKFISRRNLLFSLSGLATVGAVPLSRKVYRYQKIQTLNNPHRNFSVSQEFSLKQRAANKGLIYGTSTNNISIFQDGQYAAAIVKDCSMIVPEWEFKWTAGSAKLRPNPENFDFTAADKMTNFAVSHNLLLRGHTLVWHESLPDWFDEKVNSKNAEQLLTKHIQTVVKRYAGKIHSWDVVNEAIAIDDQLPNGLRKTPWLNFLGSDYIELAFRLTAATDPHALLVYNELGLDYDGQIYDERRTAVLKLLQHLKSQGTPIHALGIQAHLSPINNKFNPEKLRQFLRDVASLGLKILITEMDVSDKDLPLDITVRDHIIAGVYEDYLSAVLDEKAVISVVTWGLSDKYTWLNEFYPRNDGKPSRPLPLDAQMQRKLAWNAIARVFDYAPKR
jgi:endo-1,4-beta-xylanase